MPVRIQRKRTKGWRMPENTVYVGRPSKWGNPFSLKEPHLRFSEPWLVVDLFKRNLNSVLRPKRPYPYPDMIVRELRGKNLACWCPLDQPCHADVLLEIANDERA